MNLKKRQWHHLSHALGKKTTTKNRCVYPRVGWGGQTLRVGGVKPLGEVEPRGLAVCSPRGGRGKPSEGAGSIS